MRNPAARANKGIKSADLWDTRGREEKTDCVRAQSLLRFSFFFFFFLALKPEIKLNLWVVLMYSMQNQHTVHQMQCF